MNKGGKEGKWEGRKVERTEGRENIWKEGWWDGSK